jgi:hypothetical protein
MDQQKNAEALAWQISVWDRMVPVYTREIDKRFGPIVERVVKRGRSQTGSARARPWHGDWLGRAEGSRGCRAEGAHYGSRYQPGHASNCSATRCFC